MKIAVVKPDHLGDFIIAIPAIRALLARNHEVTLFIASGNRALARHYFTQLEIVALDLPHLHRRMTDSNWTGAFKALGMLRNFDMVSFLRRDGFLTPENFSEWTDYALFIEDRPDHHQSQLEQAAILPVSGSYDVDEMFFGANSPIFPSEPKAVAFAIGAGFPFKKWSPLSWAELGQALRNVGANVEILVGPGEIWEGEMIARATGLDPRVSVFVGGSDFGAVEQWLENFDLVIAVDGGSAHLCSTRKPVLSVFGPSPAARFAPIGAYNRVVTRELSCSPCVGFDTRALNACMSRECLYGLNVQDVLDTIRLPTALPGQSRALREDQSVKVKFGLSSSPL